MREEHAALDGITLPPSDKFWNHYLPPNGWNCRCTAVQVLKGKYPQSDSDRACAAANLPTANVPKGLEGNPFYTGEVFTDKVGYLRNAAPTAWKDTIKPMAREVIRQQHQNFKQTIDTSIGKVLIDDITMTEVSKGSATDKSYFLKQEIAKNIDKYTNEMTIVNQNEPIDLGHNNPKGKFSKRKRKFSHFEVYELKTGIGDYTVKFGRYRISKVLNLYSITG